MSSSDVMTCCDLLLICLQQSLVSMGIPSKNILPVRKFFVRTKTMSDFAFVICIDITARRCHPGILERANWKSNWMNKIWELIFRERSTRRVEISSRLPIDFSWFIKRHQRIAVIHHRNQLVCPWHLHSNVTNILATAFPSCSPALTYITSWNSTPVATDWKQMSEHDTFRSSKCEIPIQTFQSASFDFSAITSQREILGEKAMNT